jgi:hypothetical protein
VTDPTIPYGLRPSGIMGHPLEVVDVVSSEDQEEGDGGYGYFPYGSYDEGAGSLLEEVFQVGAEAYSGEGEQEGPAA